MYHWATDTQLVALIGAGGGVLLGVAAIWGRFCTLGAIEDLLYGGSSRRLSMWILAIGIAITANFALASVGLFSPGSTFYHQMVWYPSASILGGALFGYGMSLTGTCGFGALARLGSGDLRSLVVVLVMGISAGIVLAGPLAPLRQAVFPQAMADNPAGPAHALADLLGFSLPQAGILIGLGFMLFGLAGVRRDPRAILWAGVVAVAIISGWFGTSLVARQSYDPITTLSHTFAAPLAQTLLYALQGSARSLSFGVGSVSGVVLGALVAATLKGRFRWEACEDPRELRRQILGAAMMGVGAVLALGCTIGQGLSAFSVLAWSAPVTFAAIFAGAAFGLRQLITGLYPKPY
ncbi:hypothetical protein SAMN05421688_0579 [Poseidonocella pacifica]|uniref:Uncharacterized protein n=1 Tax=Poseidonocella pacifica TaxID=871651 RepID=A0A1I0VF13_9RHOB|nr:YeeE/YedE family protein [Poseidonocella pacifica]SFA74944.1 hypothetical protein SAMN05421688_0579 [Poseidonocella pacifica]